jgi:hypothetical protein
VYKWKGYDGGQPEATLAVVDFCERVVVLVLVVVVLVAASVAP